MREYHIAIKPIGVSPQFKQRLTWLLNVETEHQVHARYALSRLDDRKWKLYERTDDGKVGAYAWFAYVSGELLPTSPWRNQPLRYPGFAADVARAAADHIIKPLLDGHAPGIHVANIPEESNSEWDLL